MDARVTKLGKVLGSDALAEKLASVGLDTPRKIRNASDQDVTSAVGSENLSAIRAKLPGRK